MPAVVKVTRQGADQTLTVSVNEGKARVEVFKGVVNTQALAKKIATQYRRIQLALDALEKLQQGLVHAEDVVKHAFEQVARPKKPAAAKRKRKSAPAQSIIMDSSTAKRPRAKK